MHLGIEGRRALVTGASRGLGRAVAEALAAEGVIVALAAREAAPLEEAARAIASATGSTTMALQADVGDAKQAEELVRRAADGLGGVDILVCNAGGPPSGPFEAHGPEVWERAIAVNFTSTVTLCRGVVEGMKERRWGRIVTITSVAVKQPVDGLILSNSVRAGVAGLVKSLSNELAPYNVLVNNVCPGYTRTSRVVELAAAEAARAGVEPQAIYRAWEGRIPMGRLGEPREFAAAVAFLASERASYVTGVSLAVDGGFCRSLL